jgi:hypothetical protein
MVLAGIGNNDGQYHNQAPDEDFKKEYYDFMIETWFEGLSANNGILSSVKDSFENAGNYRVDIKTGLAILTFNSMYMYYRDD